MIMRKARNASVPAGKGRGRDILVPPPTYLHDSGATQLSYGCLYIDSSIPSSPFTSGFLNSNLGYHDQQQVLADFASCVTMKFLPLCISYQCHFKILSDLCAPVFVAQHPHLSAGCRRSAESQIQQPAAASLDSALHKCCTSPQGRLLCALPPHPTSPKLPRSITQRHTLRGGEGGALERMWGDG